MRAAIKSFSFSLLDASGAPALALALQRRRGFIALYHGVAPYLPNYGIYNYRKKFILPESFRRHLLWLRRRFEIIPLSTLIERLSRQEKLSRRYLAITFDDGYENVYRHAFPLLKELRIPATVFITTDLVEKRLPLWTDRLEYALGQTKTRQLEIAIRDQTHYFNLGSYLERTTTDIYLRNHLKKIPDAERKILLEEVESRSGITLIPTLATSPYRGLTWDQVREMEKNKVEFAPHTTSHPILSRMPPERAEKEITESYDLLKKRVGKPLPIFAYPNGQPDDFSETTAAILQRHGFQAALTTTPGTLSQESNLFALPRFSLDGSDDLRFFRLTISGVRKKLQDIISL